VIVIGDRDPTSYDSQYCYTFSLLCVKTLPHSRGQPAGHIQIAHFLYQAICAIPVVRENCHSACYSLQHSKVIILSMLPQGQSSVPAKFLTLYTCRALHLSLHVLVFLMTTWSAEVLIGASRCSITNASGIVDEVTNCLLSPRLSSRANE
jgi:hypothetical protein